MSHTGFLKLDLDKLQRISVVSDLDVLQGVTEKNSGEEVNRGG